MKVVGSDYMHKRPAAQRLTIMLLVAAARSPDRNLNLLSGRLCFLTQLLNVGERLVAAGHKFPKQLEVDYP